MKWIGQHIYDLVARFRSDLYLDNISTSTETDVVVVNSEGKLSKRAASGLTTGLVTVTDSTTATAFPVVFHDESNALLDDTGAFTYNPNTGTLIAPNLTVTGTTTTINTTNLNVEDKNIILNYNDSSDTSGTADGAGITIQDAVDASNDASLTWTAANDKFEFSHAVQINNGASGGVSALIIDNDDTDKNALKIDASNVNAHVVRLDATDLTTSNAINIDCNSLTTGSALNIDVDDALTLSATKSLVLIDYDKSGATGGEQSSITTGLDISMVDAATNNASGTVTNTGINVAIDAASNQGTISQTGVAVSLTDADTGIGGNSIGFQSTVEDSVGTTFDFKAISSADQNDYLALAVGGSGESYIKTVDGGAAAAHLNIQVDGIIKHTGTGGESRFYNTALNASDYMSLVVGADGDTTLTTVDAAATNAHFEVAADGNITLDAAGAISLETAVGTISSDASTFQITNSTAGSPNMSLINTTDDATSSGLNFNKTRGAAGSPAGVDGDQVGAINFISINSANQTTQYGSIVCNISESAQNSEAGKLSLYVNADHATTQSPGLVLEGEHATASEVDVTIANGAASTTTVAGTLTMGSTATLDNSGVLQTAAQTNITSLGTLSSLAVTSASDLGSAAMTLTNADIDQIALDVDASNTTANIIDINAQALTTGDAIFIDANSLTTGSAISLDIDDALTTTANKNLVHIDYDKAGVTASSQISTTVGLKIDINDNATNDAAADIRQTGISIGMDVENAQGSISQTGVYVQSLEYAGGSDLADNWKSFYSSAPNTSSSFDFYAVPGGQLFVSGQEDYFGIQTTSNGATTISTVDYSHALAHMTIQADGNVDVNGVDITLDASGDIALEANTTVTGDVITTGNIELGHASDTTIARSASGTVTIEGEQIATNIYTKKVVITQGEMNSLSTSPKEIIAAPGSNKFIDLLSFNLIVDRASTNTVTSYLSCSYDGDTTLTGALFLRKSFMLNSTTDRFYPLNNYATDTGNTDPINKNITAQLQTAISPNCTTSTTVLVTYSIIDVS